jgi:hypothetical protein
MRASRVCVSLAVVAAVIAVPAAAQEAVVLRLDPPVGQVSRYRMEGTMWMVAGADVAIDTTRPTMIQVMYATETVADSGAGIRAITRLIDSSQMELRAGPSPWPPGTDLFRGTVITRVVDADGGILSVGVVPGPNLPPVMAPRLGEPEELRWLPNRRVRVGDTWSDTITVSAGGAGTARSSTVTVTYRLERLEARDGSRVAVLSVRGEGGVPADSTHPSGVEGGYSGEMAIEIARRRVVRMTNDHRTVVHSPAGVSTLAGRVVMTLLEP